MGHSQSSPNLVLVKRQTLENHEFVLLEEQRGLHAVFEGEQKGLYLVAEQTLGTAGNVTVTSGAHLLPIVCKLDKNRTEVLLRVQLRALQTLCSSVSLFR